MKAWITIAMLTACGVEAGHRDVEQADTKSTVPDGTPLPVLMCPAGTTSSLPNHTIECPFQTKSTLDPNWTIWPECRSGDGGWYFECNGTCTVAPGSLVNSPPTAFPYCAPGGVGAPPYLSGCAGVQPPPMQKTVNVYSNGWRPSKEECEADRQMGCVDLLTKQCKLFETVAAFVEGYQGVCCITNSGSGSGSGSSSSI
jgi:hypothetical protein